MAGIPPRKCGVWFCIRPALFGRSKCGKCISKNGRQS